MFVRQLEGQVIAEATITAADGVAANLVVQLLAAGLTQAQIDQAGACYIVPQDGNIRISHAGIGAPHVSPATAGFMASAGITQIENTKREINIIETAGNGGAVTVFIQLRTE